MKRTNRNIEQMLDDTLAAVRSEKLDESTVKDATSRVWRRLSAGETATQAGVVTVDHIRGCEDFQALIPSYLEGLLSPARTLLLEDHTHECIPCRKALKEARAFRKGEAAVARPEVSRPRRPLSPVARWAIAATVTVGVGLAVWPYVQRFTRSVGALHTIVQASTGNVYRVSESSTRPLAVGDKIARGERVRAAKGSKAVLKLGDGSQVELAERSEVWVSENGEGATIHLDRGQIIVEAAKQGSKHLFVATDDSLVSVTGTIFSVNSGTKGARVSVIEGSVNVNHGGQTSTLKAGDQLATHQSIDQVKVKEEVKWSGNREKYSKMLDEVAALRKAIDDNVERPGVRYSTRLLDLAPAATVIYIAIPNISRMLGDARGIIQAKLQENAELRSWWDKEQANGKGGFDETLAKVQQFGSYLGPEIVICVQKDAKGEISEPIVLAELANAPGFEGYLISQLNSLPVHDGKTPSIRLVKDGEAIPSTTDGENLVVWMKDDLIAASPTGNAIASLAGVLKAPDTNKFNSTPFHAQLSEMYRDGAGLLVAADLEQIMSSELQKSANGNHKAVADRLGLTNVKYFIAEMKDKDGKASNRAMLTFSEKRGMANWLAAPGPMGALDFISPDAAVVAAFVADRPISIVDDILAAIETADSKAFEDLKKFESEHGLSLREDFAAPMGGEFAFALDGPMLPIPAWKVVIEVNEPEKLQQSIEKTVTELNRWVAMQGKPGLEMTQEKKGERTLYTIKQVEHGLSACYTFAYGYFIAAPNKTLVEQAIQYREAGTSVAHSPAFMATLPEDKQPNFSAMFFYNLGSAVAPLAKQGIPVPKGPINFDKPLLAYAYALGDRFTLSASTEDGAIGLRPSMLAGLPGPFGIKDIIR